MTQFYSRNDTVFNGDVYSIPFSYSKEEEINVFIDEELYTDWQFLNESQIQLLNVPSTVTSTSIVSVRRITDISEKIVDYTNNSLLNKENLNKSQDQLLQAVQEIYDNNVQFQIDTDEVIETNKQELLYIQEAFEQETQQQLLQNKIEIENRVIQFENEVNNTIDVVKEAANKVNQLEEAVDTAVTAANTAAEQAEIAINKANETTELVAQANTTIQGTIQDFTENIDSKISTNNENMQSVLAETETVLQEAKDTLDDTLNKSQITNCLLEVPQRIKYDLTDGVLTIKKGSQVIVPYGTTNENFTRVGSPTIVNGVASGFNSISDALIIPNLNIPEADNWEIKGVVQVFSNSGQQAGVWLSPKTGNGIMLPCAYPSTGANIQYQLYLSSNNSSWDICNGDFITFPSGSKVKCNLKFTGTQYIYTCTNLDTNEVKRIEVNSSLKIYQSPEVLGRKRAGTGTSAFTGQIDLKQFSITVDGKVVYRPYIQKGDRFLNDNFKVADTQYADGKFFVWAELMGDVKTNQSTSTNIYNRVVNLNITRSGMNAYVGVGSGADGLVGTGLYYNTATNFVNYYTESVKSNDVSALPPLMIQSDGTTYFYAKVTQVFNGMGYIGSTVWVDKGVKGLIPNGRNEDGSLNNVEFEVSSIIIGSRDLTQEFVPVWYQSDNTIVFSKGWEYVEATNKVTAIQDNVTTQDFCQIATVDMKAGVISNFQPKQPFHAPDIQNVVRKTGDTMSGVLELYGTSSHLGLFGGSIFTHNMNISMGTAPSSNIYFPVVEHQDKNNTRKSRVESFFRADGAHGIQLSEKHGSNYSAVTAGFDANGNPYTYAPHCNITNGIMTQAGLSKSGNGYCKFGNGVIMQWGVTGTVNAGNTTTVTLPTAFSSTNYKVTGSALYAENKYATTGINSLTKTSFKLMNISGAGGNCPFHWLAIGY